MKFSRLGAAGVLAVALLFCAGAHPQSLPWGGGGTGGGGGSPSGSAGGDLGGTYPNPTVTSAAHIANIGASPNTLTYNAFGDSNTTVSPYLPQIYPATYVDYLRSFLNVNPQNSAHVGDQACDGAEYVFKTPLPSVTTSPVYTFMEGINDAANKSAGAYEVVFNNCEQAAVSYLAIPAASKIPASSATLTGTWAASTSGYAGSPLISTTNGSTQTYTVTVSAGKPIIGWFRNSDGDGGTFSVAVDGGSATNFTTASTPAIATANGTHGASPIVLTGLSAGSHTIVVSVTSATNASNSVEVVGFAPVPAAPSQTINAYIGGVIEQANNTGAANTLAYNNDALANAVTLAGYGLPVTGIPVRNFVNSSSDMLNTLHPNATGILHYAQAYEASMGNIPVSVLPVMPFFLPTSDTKINGSVGVGLGALSAELPSTLYGNTCTGFFCMGQTLIATAINNTGAGYQAMYFLDGGHDNFAGGYEALTNLVGGSQNTATGSQAAGGAIAGALANGTFDGFKAGFAAASGNDTCVGNLACSASTTGGNVTSVGANSCQGVTTGSANTCVGNQVGNVNPTTGGSNVLIGTSSNVSTPASSTSNYLNLQNLLLADTSKGIAGFKGSAVGTPTSCGTGPAATTGSNDIVGEVTEGSSASGCTIPFANTHSAAPICQVTAETGLGLSYVTSTTGITVTNIGSLSSTKLSWLCFFASTTNNPTP